MMAFPPHLSSPVRFRDDPYLGGRNRGGRHRVRDEGHSPGRDKEVPLVDHQGLLRDPRPLRRSHIDVEQHHDGGERLIN